MDGRRLPVLVAGFLLIMLAGCAAVPGSSLPTRVKPNAVELAAVERTTRAFEAETGDARLPWVQLWTSAEFPIAMQGCVGDQSLGELTVQIGMPELSLSYRILSNNDWPDEASAARIVARCAAATPLDDRVLRLKPGDWGALYSYELTTLRPCLVAHGFPVSLIPTRVDFEHRLRTQHPWSPYDDVTVPTRFAWYALSDACPPLPAALESAVSAG